MKLSKILIIGSMLFSLFFGAGNLIFPPYLGQMAGSHTLPALAGFLITAVLLPILGIAVIAKFDGLDHLARKVNPRFAVCFTVAIYLSIGPILSIPRAASVPFEMSIAPMFPESGAAGMLIYSLVFFLIAGWLSLNPGKLIDRIGKILSPLLLLLLGALFVCFLFAGKANVLPARGAYESHAFVTGFLEGYNTMDTIAALNFGLVIAATLRTLDVKEEKDIMRYTIFCGIIAGAFLAVIYGMLSYMGMQSSGVYALEGNGAYTLRCIVNQLFGFPGAVLLAVIFTLACMTTCVGLIASIAEYFSTLTRRFSYRQWVIGIVAFSFIVCNQGLNTILSISVPILNTLYPIAIVLILLGLCDKWIGKNRFLYPCTICAVTLISLIYALDKLHLPLGFVRTLCSRLPLYSIGMGWIFVAVFAAALSSAAWAVNCRKHALLAFFRKIKLKKR